MFNSHLDDKDWDNIPDNPNEPIYCCVCDCETPHKEIDEDDVFGLALQCEICKTIWEAER